MKSADKGFNNHYNNSAHYYTPKPSHPLYDKNERISAVRLPHHFSRCTLLQTRAPEGARQKDERIITESEPDSPVFRTLPQFSAIY
jgi:hypothetical protein